jgi:hypothetical protein
LDVADVMDVIEPYLRSEPTVKQVGKAIIARLEKELKGDGDALAKAVAIVREVTGGKD